MGSMLMKAPTIPSNSGRLRPAKGEPTTKSSWPLVRPKSTWKAASRTEYGVTCASAASAFEPSGHQGADPAGHSPPAMREQGGPRAIGGQVEDGRHVRKLEFPVRPEPLPLRAGEQVCLPADEVAVMAAGRREGRAGSLALGLVDGPELVQNHHQRPVVADQVVQDEQIDVFLGRSREQLHADQRAALQVERAVSLRLDAVAQLLLSPGCWRR